MGVACLWIETTIFCGLLTLKMDTFLASILSLPAFKVLELLNRWRQLQWNFVIYCYILLCVSVSPLVCTCTSDCAGTILSSSICLPQSKDAATSCSHLATNLLSCLATLASSPPLTVDALTGTSQKFDKDSFSCVVRFNGKIYSVILGRINYNLLQD